MSGSGLVRAREYLLRGFRAGKYDNGGIQNLFSDDQKVYSLEKLCSFVV